MAQQLLSESTRERLAWLLRNLGKLIDVDEAFAAAGLPKPVPPGGLAHRSPLYKQVIRHFDAINWTDEHEVASVFDLATRALQIERNNHRRHLGGAFTDSHTYLSIKKALEHDGYTIDANLRITRYEPGDVADVHFDLADTSDQTHQAAATDALTTAQLIGGAFGHGPLPQGHYNEVYQFQVRRAADALVSHPACATLLDASSHDIYAWLTEAALVVAAEHDRAPGRWAGPTRASTTARSPLDGALARLAAAAWSRASLTLLTEIQSCTGTPSTDSETGGTTTPEG
ncbi:hypothetical protein [Nonomuraea glycinis]|uniref:hypothetical protein n=1 Tax=Nonomuraea glycinis TaxID=2047744 RepID=UPI002E162FED|nr:hypothetical protein OHA68_00880 [Nonomuraea glycinis]